MKNEPMKDRIKYILVGMIIGIVIGMALLYLLMIFRIIRPFGLGNFRDFSESNFTRNFTMPR